MASIMDVLNKYPQSVILSNPNGSKILGWVWIWINNYWAGMVKK
jgi:hypothetical protein